MAVQFATDAHAPIVAALAQYASAGDGLCYIARLQDVRSMHVRVENGHLDRVTELHSAGLGVTLFDAEGYSAFAATDDLSPDGVHEAFDIARALLTRAPGRCQERFDGWDQFSGNVARHMPTYARPIDSRTPGQLEESLQSLHGTLAHEFPELAISTWITAVEETWRVLRSDGADVSWVQPRARCGAEFTAMRAGHGASTYASSSGADYSVLEDADALARLLETSRQRAQLARDLLDAPTISAGSYTILIDHGLAKGLAHEAFGHAAESDLVETSILGREGLFRAGERVAREGIDIIDGPLEGDYAYVPFSANGEPRQAVTIVKDGVLTAPLADVYTGRRTGAQSSGAERAESYACVPMPRMSNIRIVMADALALPKDAWMMSPRDLYDLLLERGLVRRDEPVAYLCGYRGGQVNTEKGEFVFNCSAIYRMCDDAITLHQPALFSGSILSVLGALKQGLGPLDVHVAGTCGKSGQSVSSSGGSHAFLLIGADPHITLGGA